MEFGAEVVEFHLRCRRRRCSSCNFAAAAASEDDDDDEDDEDPVVRPKTVRRKYSRTIPLPIPVPPTPPTPPEWNQPPPGPSAKAKKKTKAVCSPRARMSTRYQRQRQREREDQTRASFNRVRTTVESISRRASENEPAGSLPDVFAPFSSEDLIRSDISPRETFEETRDSPQPSTGLGVASTSQANPASQSTILWPFRHFFGREETAERADSIPGEPQAASTPKE